MSFGFSIGDCLAVIQLANKVRKDFTDAPKQFEHISIEVRSLSIVLLDTDIFLSGDSISDNQKYELGTILDGCKEVLKDTESTLDKYRDLGNKYKSIGNAAKRAWKRLTFEPDDVRQLRSRITSNITLLNSFIGGVTRDNVAKVIKRQNQQEHNEVLDWLTPIDYAAQQSDFISRRQVGTGQWLLDSTEYQQWIATAKEALFCPGIPGAGKTILTSIVVNDLLERFPADGSTAVCYIYCNFRRTEEQKLDDLLGSLLKQLAQGQVPFPRSVIDLYERHQDRRTRPSIDEICTALHTVTASYSRVFVVIDALDECDVSNGCRPKFISELLHLQAQLGANLLATSRFIPEIAESFSQSANKEIRATVEDIGRYLEGCMISLPRFVSTIIDLQKTIKEKIIDAADGMFLLAKLHLDSLKGKRSPKAVRSALDRFATGSDAYDAAYTDAMDRISSQLPDQKELAFQALSWIACAKRQLKTVELQHALGTEPGESAFDEENVPDIQDVVSNCCGLVTVDEQTQIVRLVHYTTQEYFERTQNTWFPDGQTNLTEICISYLCFDVFKAGRCESDQDFETRLSTYQLDDYASHYWGAHAKLGTGHQRSSISLGTQSQDNLSFDVFHGNAGLHCSKDAKHLSLYPLLAYASRFWLFHAEQALLYDKPRDVIMGYLCNERALTITYHALQRGTFRGRAPKGIVAMHLVAHFGLQGLMMQLKAAGTDLDVSDENGETPLLWAARHQQEGMTQLLAEQGANVNTADFERKTALHHAAKSKSLTMLKTLLRKGAVLTQDVENMTPLHYAVLSGWKIGVTALLDAGVAVDLSIRRVLFVPAYENGLMVFERLDGAQQPIPHPSDASGSGLTPLHLAALIGYSEMVQFLLQHGADPAAKSDFGETPLHLCVGSQTIDEQRGDIWAEGSQRIESLFDNIDMSDEEEYDETFRHICKERMAVISKLLASPATQVNAQNRAGSSCLHIIDYGGRRFSQEIADLLLKIGGASVDLRDRKGMSPLHLACKGGDPDVVKTFLDHGACTKLQDNDGCNALHHAAGSSNDETLNAILNHTQGQGRSLVAVRDAKGRNVLHHLLSWLPSMEALKYLLTLGADVNTFSSNGESPLAAFLGSRFLPSAAASFVQVMLDWGADILAPNPTTGMGLHHVMARSSEIDLEVLRLLASHGLNLKDVDNEGRTILHHAARSGFLTQEALEFMLHEVGVALNAFDNTGKSPVSLAVEMKDRDEMDVWSDARWAKAEKLLLSYCNSRSHSG